MPRRIGQYDILGTVGVGSRGTVYLGSSQVLGRRVAIKQLSTELAGDPIFLRGLRTDVEIGAALDHPNCVKVWELIETDSGVFIVSEYVHGASLRSVMRDAGPLTPVQCLGIIKAVLTGLGYAHSRGLFHEDVRPENVLIDKDGAVKLNDFGQTVFRLSTDGAAARNSVYTSPEQLSGEHIDQRSDVYSCGVMLYELLTGKLPYSIDDVAEMSRHRARTRQPDPRSVNPEIPRLAAAMVMQAMSAERDERQQSAQEFLDQLEAVATLAYGEAWQAQSSIEWAVPAAMAATPPAARTRQRPATRRPLRRFAVRPRTPIVATGGAAAALIVIGGAAAALMLGGFFRSNQHGVPLAIATRQSPQETSSTPVPSPSAESPSPQVGATPQPSASPEPSPSPTAGAASPNPTPRPGPSHSSAVAARATAPAPTQPASSQPPAPAGPAPAAGPTAPPPPASTAPTPGPIAIPDPNQPATPLQVYFEYCAGGISSNCTSLANGSTGQVFSFPCRSGDQIWVFEQYSYYDPGPGGNPTQVTVAWGGANADGSGIPADTHADANLQPGTRGSHAASASAANIIEVRGGNATGNIYFSLTWTDPNGSLRRTAVETANVMRWSCSG